MYYLGVRMVKGNIECIFIAKYIAVYLNFYTQAKY